MIDTPIVAREESSTPPKTPAERLAEKIMTRLVADGVLQSEQASSMLPKLASGKLRPQDWRLPIEIALEKGAAQ